MVKILVKTPRAVRRANRRLYFESLLGGSCVNCSSTKNLEFDHVIPEDKLFDLATSYMEYAIETVLPELQKCQLLCRPCHSEKTALDNGYNLFIHGKPSMYSNHGCRCGDCTSAWRVYVKKYTDKYSNSDIERRRKQRRKSSKTYYDRKRVLLQNAKMV